MRSIQERVKLSFNFILTLVAMLTMAQTTWAECDYAVYYTYGSKNYYLEQGDQVVNVSTVLQQLQLYGVCTDVQTFDDSFVTVTAVQNDWTLQVKKAFDSRNITCTINGQAYDIRVTSLKNSISVVLYSVIVFDKQGGTGEYKTTWQNKEYTDRQPVRENSMYELPECPYTAPEGCTFAGWELNGKIYQENELYFFTGKTTAKALWKNSNDEIINRAPEHNISIASGLEHGSIDVQATAREGEVVPVKILPDEGYFFRNLSVNGTRIDKTFNGDGDYTFTMPTSDVTITAESQKALAGGTESAPVSINDPDVYFLKGGWYIVDHDITFHHPISYLNDIHIILADGCTMNLGESTYPLNDYSIFALNGGNVGSNVSYEKFSITIHGQASGTGKLNIYSDCARNISAKNLTIKGGKVYALYGNPSVSYSTNFYIVGDIRIEGGELTAIGGRTTSTEGKIYITGGKVKNTTLRTDTYDIIITGGTCESSELRAKNYLLISAGKIKDCLLSADYKVELGCSDEDDYIIPTYINPNIVSFKSGVVLTDGTNVYSGFPDPDEVGQIVRKTLRLVPGPYYTVHFNTNSLNGDVVKNEMPDQSIAGTGKLSRNKFYYKDHTFSGWNTAADGSGTPYANMATVTLTADLELYAQWDKSDNTVTWKNGNTTLGTDENVAYGTMPSYDGDVPTKASDEENNYVFTGWYPTPGVVTTNVTYSAMFTTVPKAQSLADNADNSTLISTLAANGGTWDVTLSGRTLSAGSWNTFAVPFNMAIPSGWTVKELTGATDDGSTITLAFGDATSIEAGKPYLVQVPSNVANPVFSNVTVNSTANPATFANVISFVPTFGLTALPEGKDNILFLAAGNTLKHPSAEGQNLKGFRAYFQLLGGASQARTFRLDLGEKVTGVTLIDNGQLTIDNYAGAGATYNLNGQKVSDDYKGIVIKNGKKYVIE